MVMVDKNYKRQYRELDDDTKQKISQSLRGRSKSYSHAQNISKGLKNYWQNVPSKNKSVEPDKADGIM